MKLNQNHCDACSAEFHLECPKLRIFATGDLECCCPEPDETIEEKLETLSREDGEITDAKSTGRKRAAKLYPLTPDLPCEWQGLKAAGGGSNPIIGCINGIARHRHHGPDKDTLNNSQGNVHRICHHCHNRWHSSNDKYFLEFFGTEQWQAHDSESKAAPEELIKNEAFWKLTPARRIKDED